MGVLLFEGAEELDFAGPWEVLTVAAMLKPGDRVVTIAERADPVRCAKGLRVLPDHTIADAPPLDVLLVPGGEATVREAENARLVAWIAEAGRRATWVTSVCTGAQLLHRAGFLRGRKATTHWMFVDGLRAMGDGVDVREHVRFVVDGNVVTSAGVSAGIDMALWLVGRLHDPGFARLVQRGIEYDPAPPWQYEG
jgi:transcriptional regulator GlxA family with amidase domain